MLTWKLWTSYALACSRKALTLISLPLVVVASEFCLLTLNTKALRTLRDL
jgi:hypothetical protein